MERDIPLALNVITNSLAVVSSSLCIISSIVCNTVDPSLVGRPHLSSAWIVPWFSICRSIRHTVCRQVNIPSWCRVFTISETVPPLRDSCRMRSLAYIGKRGRGRIAEKARTHLSNDDRYSRFRLLYRRKRQFSPQDFAYDYVPGKTLLMTTYPRRRGSAPSPRGYYWTWTWMLGLLHFALAYGYVHTYVLLVLALYRNTR